MGTMLVDINCDLGESFGVYAIGEDDGVLPWITSANVACGFHGGDPRVMERTVREADRLGVHVGAHPGFPDLVGFGRRNLGQTPEETRTDALYQIGALAAFTLAAGIPLRHVKPHGQMNNMAVLDRALARALVEAAQSFDPDLIFVAYGGELLRAAEESRLTVAYEVYADRAYLPDGTLVPRSQPGAVITNLDQIIERAITMVRDGRIQTITGETLHVRADSICVHGDTPGAASIAKALRTGLETTGIRVRPLTEVLEARSS